MKLTVHTFLTLDGVMQGPGGADEDPSNGFDRGGWLVPHVDDDFGRIVDAWFSQDDEFLLGGSTYDMMHADWSKVTDPENPVATALNGLPRHVVPTNLTDPTWKHTTLSLAPASASSQKAPPPRRTPWSTFRTGRVAVEDGYETLQQAE